MQYIQGVFFNWSAQISLLKRKTLFNLQGSFVHQEFHGTESLIGCPLFFILVLKIGRTSKKNHPVEPTQSCCRSHQAGVVQGRRHSYLETLKPGDTLGTFSHRETFSHQWTFSTCILPQLQSFHLLKSSHSRIHTLP